MALIKSTILAQISGSINGTTFSHNQGGAYARNRSMVSNPQTDRQDQVRTAMTSLSKMWGESLTPEQREDWNAYGGSITVMNRVGDPISLSGIAAFQKVNMFRVGTLEVSPTLIPPAATGTGDGQTIPSFISAEWNYVSPDLTFDVTVTADPTPYDMLMWVSAPLSPGIKYFRGPYAFRTKEADVVPPTADVYHIPVPVLQVGNFAEGQWRAVKVVMYNSTSFLPIWTINVDPTEVPILA